MVWTVTSCIHLIIFYVKKTANRRILLYFSCCSYL